MGAALLEQDLYAKGRYNDRVASAGYGLNAKGGHTAALEWSELQSETGVNLNLHRSQWIGDLRLDGFDLIICAEPKAVEEVLARGAPQERVILANPPDGIPNPWQKGIAAYWHCYLSLRDTVIPQLIQHI